MPSPNNSRDPHEVFKNSTTKAKFVAGGYSIIPQVSPPKSHMPRKNRLPQTEVDHPDPAQVVATQHTQQTPQSASPLLEYWNYLVT
jgi:hypothetical protein